MPRIIKNINRNIIEFDRGIFDDWCVYLTRHSQSRYAPKDTEYFYKLYELGKRHGHAKIYNDFLKFYAPANKNIDAMVLDIITSIGGEYGNDAEEMDIWFSVIYAGMVAEENKSFAVLKKRIKRLGMHQVLLEGFAAGYAANFSKGKRWQELDLLMRKKGF